MLPKYNSILIDLEEKLAFEEEERADTPLFDREDRFYLDGKILAYRYAIQLLLNVKDSHKEAIDAVLEQFDSYKSNCLECKKEVCCPGGYDNYYTDLADVCEENNLICREKLLAAAAAAELDAQVGEELDEI